MNRRIQIAWLGCWILGAMALPRGTADERSGIAPWPENPWYWSYLGQPSLLMGGSGDDNLFQWPSEQLLPHLDRMREAGANVIRNTMSDRKDKGFEVYPFLRLDDGRYDLNQWNPEYWNRFERMLRETKERGIIVQIEVWDRFDYADNGGSERWQIHPYNPKNNVNYTYQDSGFAERYPDHPGSNKQPFFFTTPEQRNNETVLAFQKKFVGKMLRHALEYDHVLYCIDNETKAQPEWAVYWTKFIKGKASERGKTVYVTEMWDDWDLKADRHKRTFDHPELYDFVDISQNNHNRGDEHWENFLYVKRYLDDHPRPMNTTKIYGASGNKFGHTDQDGIERFWRHLLGGAASVRFHRPDSGLGLNDKAVRCIRAARKVESRVPYWELRPRNDLLEDREKNEAFLAANPGRAYVLYFTDGGSVKIDLREADGVMSLSWVDIDSGEWGDEAKVEGGKVAEIAAPQKGNWAAVILASSASDRTR